MSLKMLSAGVLLCLLGSVILASCSDDFMSDGLDGNGAKSNISMTVSYYPDVTTDVQTRTSGDAMEQLRKIAVVVFDEYGQLYDVLNEDSLLGLNKEEKHNDRPQLSEEDRTYNGSWTEGEQACATFRIQGLPFGRYKLYCVANTNITRSEIAFDPTKKEEEIKNYGTEEGKLRSYSLTWNSGDIAANDAMFGFFTVYDEKTSDVPLSRNDAQIVTIDKTTTRLHAWVKRAASKVTVAFDPSGLHQNVSIFIHKVTIKDIPRTCLLGMDNKPVVGENEDPNAVLIKDGETIYYNNKGEEVTVDPGDGDANHLQWMELNNGQTVRGSDHSATSKALFFFENMQGDYSDKEDKERYNKEPKAGWVHAYQERPVDEWNKTPWDYDTKDKIAAGTYIEVEGYYESTNDFNVTSGPIKYRFMLGKNTTYNYNAQRNHHYKVTLKFKGWANQPEWHIEYVEDTPDLDAPDFYMPYNYRERSELPIRFIGDLMTLKVEIVENDWAPYNFDDNLKTISQATYTPPLSLASLTDADSQKNVFMWNRPSWEVRNGISTDPNLATVSGGKGDQYLGFLALTMPLNPPANVLDNYSYSDGDDVLEMLKQIYEKGDKSHDPEWLAQNERSYNAADLTEGQHPKQGEALDQSQTYTVYKDGNATTLLMPLFTRAKSMINAAGWSGNNPYEFHSRIAKLKITATFSVKDKDGNDTEVPLTRYVRVIQRPRITNPKAIWKSVDTKHPNFEVTMMTRKSDALNADYTPFKSNGSWTVEVEKDPNNNFTLDPGPNCEYEKDGKGEENKNKLIGKTNTEMVFKIKFGGKEACGIVHVKYHAEKCSHRIFVRQGDAPIQISGGGATWLSHNLQHGGNGTYNYTTTASVSTDATLVDTPLSFGSYFKYGQLCQGIDESNNDTYWHLKSVQDPTKASLRLSDKKATAAWVEIPCKRFTTTTSAAALNYSWRDVKVVSGETYSLPTYDDFLHLTNNSEFGFGILYGDDAEKTKEKFNEATGYAKMWKPATSAYGMRVVIAYNKGNGNQVYFPLSASGDGRRHQAFMGNDSRPGRLIYGDTDRRLTEEANKKNVYRPIPYNIPYSSGALYWIKKIKDKGHHEADGDYPCAAWDMNYFNFDFGPYTANCLTYYNSGTNSDDQKIWNTGSDALPIRLVKSHAQ